jgi:hypothetical protein
VSEEQQNESVPGWKATGWFIAWMAAVVLLGMAMVPPCASIIIDKANQGATVGNCRQIVAALKLYAADHGGQYPDADPSGPTTANQAFRVLIREGVLDDERVFGAMSGLFNTDNNIGEAPDFNEALQPCENHWAMTKGATFKNPPVMPLTFENAVSNGWPPKWNADAAGEKEPGRAWKGGKIIVGFNDSSVELIQLESAKGTSVGPKKGADGKDVFTRAAESMQILDIER